MEDKYMIGGHKLLWHLDRLRGWTKQEKIAPLHIELAITTGCNLRCNYCYGVFMGQTTEKNRFDIPKEALMRLFKDAKEIGVKSITLIGEGEKHLKRKYL